MAALQAKWTVARSRPGEWLPPTGWPSMTPNVQEARLASAPMLGEMSARRWRLIGVALIGLIFIVVGVGRMFGSIEYPAGDWRGDPVISAAVNLAVALVGVTIIVGAAVLFARHEGLPGDEDRHR